MPPIEIAGVCLDDQLKLYTVNWGILQESTSGTLLFLIYINILINCTSVTPRLFEDDTCLCFSFPELARDDKMCLNG